MRAGFVPGIYLLKRTIGAGGSHLCADNHKKTDSAHRQAIDINELIKLTRRARVRWQARPMRAFDAGQSRQRGAF
jgi:hypothetical protein